MSSNYFQFVLNVASFIILPEWPCKVVSRGGGYIKTVTYKF